MSGSRSYPKKRQRLKLDITSEERIKQRDRKLFEREKAFAMSLNKKVMFCQCEKCMGNKEMPFKKVERHLEKNGRYFWSRVLSGKHDRDSSDEEWEMSVRQPGYVRPRTESGVRSEENELPRSDDTPVDTEGHRPTGRCSYASRSTHDEGVHQPGDDVQLMPEQAAETRFKDAVLDMFCNIDKDDSFEEEFLEMIGDFANPECVRVLTTDHAEPTPGDDVDIVLDHEVCEDDPLARFEEWMKPLYEGATQSTLEFTVILVNLCTEHRVPQVFINSLLCFLRRKAMPQPNNVPPNWYHAKKLIMKLGLEYVNIDACRDGCVLFRKEYAELLECPKCHTARYKDNSKIPVNRVRWFPLIPRLRRLLRCPSISELMSWAFDHKTNGDLVHHVGDSKQWKYIDWLYPQHAKNPLFLHLALMLDGVNPFQMQSVKHSMWPFMIVNYNLPPWLTTKRFFVMLSVLVSGAKSITQENVDVYLQPLYEELHQLWEPGVKAFDPLARMGKKSFTLHAILMWTINDYPALGYISGLQTGGNIGCTVCGGASRFARAKALFKSVLLNSRRWLPPDHPWRTEAFAHLFDGMIESRGPPPRQSATHIEAKGQEKAAFDEAHRSQQGTGKKKKKVAGDPYELHGVKRRSALYDLPYWPLLPIRHCLDVMHLEKNFCENLLNFLLGIKDTKAVRDDMQKRGIRPELWSVPAPNLKNKYYLPQAPYVLTESKRDTFMRRLKSIKVPYGYSGSWGAKVELADKPKDHKLFGLKSHDFHVLMQQLLPVCLRGLLPDEVRRTIFDLSSVFQRLCKKDFDPNTFPQLMSDTVLVLCRLEMHFPPAFFDPMTHLLIHAVEELEWCGPVHTRWMYFGERTLAHYTRYSSTRANVAGSIATYYVREEAMGYMTEYMTHMDAYSQRVWDKEEDPEVEGEVLEGKGTQVTFTEEELLLIHKYVLDNALELAAWRRRYTELVKSGQLSESVDLANWLEEEIPKHYLEHPDDADLDPFYLCRPPSLKALSYQKMWAYGCHYKVMTKDGGKPSATYDSGVSGLFECQVEEGSTETEVVQYVGELTHIFHMAYNTRQPVVVMKARWVRPHHERKHPSMKRDDDGILSANFKQLLPADVDPYVLPNAVHQVFYLSHEARNSGWRVVMTAEPRSKRMYEVPVQDEAPEMES